MSMSKKRIIAILLLVPLAAFGLWVGGARYLKSDVDRIRSAATTAYASGDCPGALELLAEARDVRDFGGGLGYESVDMDEITGWRWSWKLGPGCVPG